MPGGKHKDKRTPQDYQAEIDYLRQQLVRHQRQNEGWRRSVELLQQRDAYNAITINKLSSDNRILKDKLHEEQAKRNQLEKTHMKTVKGIEHNATEEIIGTLKDDIKRLQTERDDKEKQIVELESNIGQLQTTLSKVASEKMTDGNPAIADLSDPFRPQKLTEMFSILYDNIWTEAYEQIEKEMDEKQTCAYLLDLFKTCWKFCKEKSDTQMQELEKVLIMNAESNAQSDTCTTLSTANLKLIHEIRKTSAREILPRLYQAFKVTRLDVKKEVQSYIEACLEICWYSTVNEPPLQYVFEADEQPEDFRSYTQGGKHVDFIVWPAMHLYTNGPILLKGVAQFTD